MRWCFRMPAAAALTNGILFCHQKPVLKILPASSAAVGSRSLRASPTSAHLSQQSQCLVSLHLHRFLHTPWRAPPDVLSRAAVQLGVTYPQRIIEDLAAARRHTVRHAHSSSLRSCVCGSCGNNRMFVTLFCACCDAVRRSSRCWMRGALRCT